MPTAGEGFVEPRAREFSCTREGVRLDRALADETGCGRREARAWVRAGLVLVDGARLPAATRLARGARIVIEVGARSVAPIAAPELVVLAEGRDWLALAKQAGVHSVVGGSGLSIARALIETDTRFESASLHPRDGGLVHRLDRDTSGVLLAARTRESWLPRHPAQVS
jgi:23S rRNA pseudouridine1911/1915/1917 synthase